MGPPKRPASTNPSACPSSSAMSSRRNVPSLSPPFKILRSLLPNVPLDSENPTAKRLSSPSPNKSVSNLSTDTPTNPHQHPLTDTLPPLLPLNKSFVATPMKPNDPFVNLLCRSIAQKCFQDQNYLSIFINLFICNPKTNPCFPSYGLALLAVPTCDK